MTILDNGRSGFPLATGASSVHPLQMIQNLSGAHFRSLTRHNGIQRLEHEASHRPYRSLEVKNTWSHNSTSPHFYPFWLLKAPSPWSSLPTVTVTFLHTTLKMDTADVSETLVPILQKYKASDIDDGNPDHRGLSSLLQYPRMSQLYPVQVCTPHVYEDQHSCYYILSPALTLKKNFAFCPHSISRVLSD